jgi:hypothetical protein
MESCWNLLSAASGTKGTSHSVLITEPYICTLTHTHRVTCLCSLIWYKHSQGALGAAHTWRKFKHKITVFWKKNRTEFTELLFCSAVSSDRRLEQLCAALDTNGLKSPQKLPLWTRGRSNYWKPGEQRMRQRNRSFRAAGTATTYNPLTPNVPYRGRTAPLTSKRYILYRV